MTTSMLQLNPAWRVLTPHGEGEAWAIIDYGMEWNPVFIVALDNGDFNNYNTKDVKRMGNHTTGVHDPGFADPDDPTDSREPAPTLVLVLTEQGTVAVHECVSNKFIGLLTGVAQRHAKELGIPVEQSKV